MLLVWQKYTSYVFLSIKAIRKLQVLQYDLWCCRFSFLWNLTIYYLKYDLFSKAYHWLTYHPLNSLTSHPLNSFSNVYWSSEMNYGSDYFHRHLCLNNEKIRTNIDSTCETRYWHMCISVKIKWIIIVRIKYYKS